MLRKSFVILTIFIWIRILFRLRSFWFCSVMGYNAQKPKLLTQSMLTSSRLSVRKTSKARAQAMTAPGQLQNKCAWDNMADNSSVVSEWTENFRLSQLTPSLLFGCIFFFTRFRGNKLLVNHSIKNFFFQLWMFLQLSSCTKRLRNILSVSLNVYRTQAL